ncbi:MAG: hypothetical protein B6D61_02380 [Bacteroidetes bacterium 4484_249]|nr:MAG: hypothetical protein B6D61_02380 [Bacteroidetes bacterium 4484_249]
MKKSTIITGIAILILMAITLCSTAQNPPHPNGGSGPGTSNTPVGGGAPLDGGVTIMLILGAAYGGKKVSRAFFERD